MRTQYDVLNVTRSPLDKLRWWLALSCGHGFLVTQKSRPTTKRIRCLQCEAHKRMGDKYDPRDIAILGGDPSL